MNPVKDAVTAFSNNAVELEREYRKFYNVKEMYTRKGLTFPHATLFDEASDAINKERLMRLAMLKGMKALELNPADYGLSVYGLKKSDVDAAYPGLRYNVAETLGVAPVVFGAVAVTAILALSVVLSSVLTKLKKVDLIGALTEQYKSKGYTPDAAYNQAKKDVDEATGNKGIFGGLSDAAKYGAIAAGLWLLYSINKKA